MNLSQEIPALEDAITKARANGRQKLCLNVPLDLCDALVVDMKQAIINESNNAQEMWNEET